MTAKFRHTLSDTVRDIKKGAVATARDINDNTKMAYDVKVRTIEEKHIPKFAKDVLTPAEIKRSERIGLVIGVVGVVAIIVFLLYILAHNLGWW